MALEAAPGPGEVVAAALMTYGDRCLVNGDRDAVEWRLLCSVLKRLEHTYYSDGVLDALFRQVRPGAEVVDLRATVKLAPLINSILEHSQAWSLATVLRVRKVTGDVVLSLNRKEMMELLSVRALRAEVSKAVARRIEDVMLIAGVQQLQDSDALEALLAGGTVQEVVVAIQQSGPQFDPFADPLTQLPALKWMLLSNQSHEQLGAAAIYRLILSVAEGRPIQLIIDQGVVPRLLELCEAEDPKIQLEAAWALTNVASGTCEQTRAVAEDGLPVFVRLLRASSADVREPAVWALGNIAGDSPQMRDRVLQAGAMQPFLALFGERDGEELPLQFLRSAVWTLSNLCRGKLPSDSAVVALTVETLARTIKSEDEEVISDTAWALSHIANSSKQGVIAVLDSGVLPRCVELLSHHSPLVLKPALRAVLNIVSGGDVNQKQQVLSEGVLPPLRALMDHEEAGILTDSCRAVSDILALGQAQIQEVIDAGIVPALLQSLRYENSLVKLEVAKALQKATSCGSTEQIEYMVKTGCVPAMIAAIRRAAPTTDQVLGPALMRGLENILEVGQRLMGWTAGTKTLLTHLLDQEA